MRSVLLVLHGLIFAFSTTQATEAKHPVQLRYRVMEGDTLGGILDRFAIFPLWGPRGRVEETKKINVIEGDADQRLTPGRIIILPVEQLSLPEEGYEINDGLIESRQIPSKSPDTQAGQAEPVLKTPVTSTPAPTPENSRPWKWTADGTLVTNSFSIQSRDPIGGGTSRIYGDWAPGIGLSIIGKSETLWSFGARVDYQNYAIAEVSKNKKILNQNGSRLGFEFAAGKAVTDQLSFSILFGSSDQLFNQALSATLFQIDKIRVYHWGFDLDFRIQIRKDLQLSIRPRYLFLGSGSGPGYEVRSGSIWGGALRGYWKRFFLDGGVLQHRQDTSIITNEDTQYTVGLGYEFGLFN
ncbi:MAG: hypothetical protein KGP28_05885 [Bdellovibrionales bacterium]|nr:hypothetical protein [Bdellovibrionales bacterium]